LQGNGTGRGPSHYGVVCLVCCIYRVLFRDLMDSLHVSGEDNMKMNLQEVGWGGLELVDMAEDRDR